MGGGDSVGKIVEETIGEVVSVVGVAVVGDAAVGARVVGAAVGGHPSPKGSDSSFEKNSPPSITVTF